MACSGCQKRREIAQHMVRNVKAGNISGMTTNLKQMATSLVREPPKPVALRVKSDVAKDYRLKELPQK